MSELLPGVPRAPAGPTPKDASAVVLVRRLSSVGSSVGFEVFWVRRDPRLSFAGGFYAFPGGRREVSDSVVPVEGASGLEASLRVTAARELFEEVGVLVAQGAEALDVPTLDRLRRELIERKTSFEALLEGRGLRLTAGAFTAAGRWITPAFMPMRFDTRFYLTELPPAAQPRVWPGELVEGAWVNPADALEGWAKGTVLLHPPTLHVLQVLAQSKERAAAIPLLQSPPHCPAGQPTRIELQQGIRLYPLQTPTLPPATHTNSYILGNGELIVVDPGSGEVRQYARLLAVLASLAAEGARVKAIVLTHHHRDHVGGVAALAQRLHVPVWCHELTAERLGDVPVDRLLKEGDVLTLAGAPPMRFTVLHTPGHARGHICLMEQASRAVVAGDMVAGVGTILIDPPEGDMTEYVAQLKRLKELKPAALYPAHGPVIPDGQAKFEEYLHHRALRERQVEGALSPPGVTVGELAVRAYPELPEEMHPVATRATLSILIKLVREGRAERREDRYFPVAVSD